MSIVALAGGVGGAKLAAGLAALLPPERLRIVVNTGDDFEHLGLHISPDLDTVMYTLAGIANPESGWGLAGETWGFMQALERLGGAGWFRLGDRDLATHIVRTQRLHAGESLSAVTRDLCRQLGVEHAVLPASDDPVRTIVDTDEGRLPFQDYFVRRRCEPAVRGFAFEGADAARPSPAFAGAEAFVICPSNPYVSIGPMLAMPAVTEALRRRAVPAIAVSPIVGGDAVKGPAAKMMRELGVEVSALSIARHYRGLIDMLVIDEQDAALAPGIADFGIRPLVAPTLMRSDADRQALARIVLEAQG